MKNIVPTNYDKIHLTKIDSTDLSHINIKSPNQQSAKVSNKILKEKITEEYDFVTDDIERTKDASIEDRLLSWRKLNSKKDKFYSEIPLLFQTDFDYIPYSEGTVSTSGCGITAISMVATYLKDELHSPGELGLIYNEMGTDNNLRLEAAANGLGLSWEKNYYWNDAKEAVANGHPVIILVTDKSIFKMGHFVVMTGISDDGRIYINDPYAPNYNRDDLKDGFENGFYEEQILGENTTGYGGAWIFENKHQYRMRLSNEIEDFLG